MYTGTCSICKAQVHITTCTCGVSETDSLNTINVHKICTYIHVHVYTLCVHVHVHVYEHSMYSVHCTFGSKFTLTSSIDSFFSQTRRGFSKLVLATSSTPETHSLYTSSSKLEK